MKLFKFYEYWSDFIADKISDSKDDSTYYDFENNESVLGEPNVKYNQVCFIEDKKCIWTHGQKYTSAEAAGVSQDDLTQAIKKHTDKQPKDLVKGLSPSLNYESNWARMRHYSIQKNANGDYTDLTSYFTYFERATDKACYVGDYTTYTDEDGNLQNSYTYYAYGHAGLMGVDDVRSMWQSWHAVRFMPEKLAAYFSSHADMSNAYITSYYKAEEGEEYNTTQKIYGGEDGMTWTGEFEKRKEFGKWKSENTALPVADTSHAGVITAEDKVKLDSLGVLSDFTVSSESGNVSGEKVVRENFTPSESVFSDLVSVNFKKGDKISISADLSKCEKTECEMIAFGKDISSWGHGLDTNKGVFHIYHKHSGSTHNILVNYVDKNYQGGLKYNGNTGLAIDGDTVTIELGYDTTLLTPFLTINGTNVIGTASFVTVSNMNDWLDQKSIYIGSVSEASTGKLTNVLYNYIKILKSQATSADGVKVNYSVGEDDNEFIIPNATSTANGAMSLEDKKIIEGISSDLNINSNSNNRFVKVNPFTNSDTRIYSDGKETVNPIDKIWEGVSMIDSNYNAYYDSSESLSFVMASSYGEDPGENNYKALTTLLCGALDINGISDYSYLDTTTYEPTDSEGNQRPEIFWYKKKRLKSNKIANQLSTYLPIAIINNNNEINTFDSYEYSSQLYDYYNDPNNPKIILDYNNCTLYIGSTYFWNELQLMGYPDVTGVIKLTTEEDKFVTKIEISKNDKWYELDLDKMIELGILKEVTN